MEFKEATSALIDGLSVEDIAKAIGCSKASILQARLPDGAKARRTPPKEWEEGVASLAEKQGERLLKLAKALDRQRMKAAK